MRVSGEGRLHPVPNQGGTTKLARPSSLSRGGGFFIGTVLKRAFNFVLGLKTSSTYPSRYVSGVFVACGRVGKPV
jgi:hypothetical protein